MISLLWGSVKGALSGVWGYLAVGLATLAAVLTALRGAKKAGQNEVIVEAQKKEIENVQAAGKVEQELAGTKPDARRERLFDRWSRD